MALLCLAPTEPDVTGIDRTLVAGRWFKDPDELGIILPEHIAGFLGLTRRDLGANVLLFGKELTHSIGSHSRVVVTLHEPPFRHDIPCAAEAG